MLRFLRKISKICVVREREVVALCHIILSHRQWAARGTSNTTRRGISILMRVKQVCEVLPCCRLFADLHAELFYSLKNAFSKLELDENKKGEKKEYNFKQSTEPHQFGISDHKAIAQRIYNVTI